MMRVLTMNHKFLRRTYGHASVLRWLMGLVCIWSIILAQPRMAVAGDISVETTVNRSRVPLDGSVQLTVTIYGAQVGQVNLPPLDGFQARYLHPSTSFSWVNGKSSQSQSHTFALYPERTGTFQVPAMSLSIKGKTYTTQPLKIEVYNKVTPHQQYSPQQSQEPVALEDRIFLQVDIPRKDYYLYEEIPVTIKLSVSGLSVGDIQFPVFEKTGFFSGDFQQPRRYEDSIDGVRFEILEFKTTVYPQRTGSLDFGPVQLNCSLRRQRQKRRRSIFEEDFFGGAMMSEDFFDEFFGRVEKRPYAVRADAQRMNILPLPNEGQPATFSGAVGQFTFQVAASPTTVNVGDPITLKARIRGRGDLRQVRIPSHIEDDKFKVYEPEVKEDHSIKTLEQVLIPKSDKIRQVPALAFSYFDPQTKKYQTIKQGPFAITVEKSLNDQALTVIAHPATTVVQTVQETLGRDIIFIKEKAGPIYTVNYRFYKSLKIKLWYVIITLIFIVFLILFNHNQKIKTDIAYARRLKAPKAARKGIKAARKFLEQNQPEDFYNQIFKTLRNYFGNKLHLPSQGLTFDKLDPIVKSKNMEENQYQKLKDICLQCDEVRFASMTIDKSKMQQSLKACEELIDDCERKWK